LREFIYVITAGLEEVRRAGKKTVCTHLGTIRWVFSFIICLFLPSGERHPFVRLDFKWKLESYSKRDDKDRSKNSTGIETL